jgi:hypothetical protein
VPAPLPPDVADHVAAVALFGKPSARFMHAINDPPIALGPQYVPKTVDLCVDNDLVCDSHGTSFSAHTEYEETGMVDQGVTFVASQLRASWAADVPVPAAPPAGGPVPSLLTASAPLTPPAPAAGLAPPPAPPGGPSPHLPPTPLTLPGPVAPVAPPQVVGPLA